MTTSIHCEGCGAPLEGAGPRCTNCEASSQNGDNPMLATVDHSPSVHPAKLQAGGAIAGGEIVGEYRVIRQLGKGGMGSVYEAEELESGRRVALKLFGQSLDSSDAKQRFLREGRLAASISHPNTVYVFGTEEINGVPAISMELVAGGTLEAKVRQEGPMPVGKAVDTILQIIEGLEAAQKLGVLHRDIKASNCFLDANGAVKVGDFGLSVSTSAKTDLKLTTTGSFLGTPSYASPEQLRGQTMDLRSDIYSVGVTLFYLLTGKIPFEADSFVQLIAAVLEQPTPSAAQLRKEVPRDLAAVVSKCLDKQPARRFQSYAELKVALEPFTSAAPSPAGLPLRMAAGTLDSLILFFALGLPSTLLMAFGGESITGWLASLPGQRVSYLFQIVVTLAYYAISESFWGATPGKALLGIRVIDANRGSPSIWAALIRAAIFFAAPSLPTWIFLGFRPAVTGSNTLDVGVILLALAIYPMLALLFVTCRKRNGNAAIQDLASRTRVILKPEKESRPRSEYQASAVSDQVSQEKIGPYRVVRRIGDVTSPSAATEPEWLLAVDEKLGREVWIRRCSPSDAPFANALSGVARGGRLRWLGGKREPGAAWDAFESVSGSSLRSLLDRPHGWEAVRYWLADLSQELAASEADRSLPPVLSLDRVWITNDNRAKLLDVRAPGAQGLEVAIEATRDSSTDLSSGSTKDNRPSLLLSSVAASALGGKELFAPSVQDASFTQPLPLHANQILRGIAALSPPQATANELATVLKRRVRATRLRRLMLVVAALLFPLFTAGVPFSLKLFFQQWDRAQPEVQQIHVHMELIADGPFLAANRAKLTPEEREFVELIIATKFAPAIKDSRIWESFYAQNVILPWERTAAEKLIKRRPPASAEELAVAEAAIAPVLKKNVSQEPFQRLQPAMAFLSFFTASALMYAAIPALFTAIAFRSGILLAMLGMVVIDRTGNRASRWRTTWRAIVAWGTIPFYITLAIWLSRSLGQEPAAWIALVLMFGLYLLSPLLPVRGIPDRLAGTYLVMK